MPTIVSPIPVIPTVTGTDPSGMTSGINRPPTQFPGPTSVPKPPQPNGDRVAASLDQLARAAGRKS